MAEQVILITGGSDGLGKIMAAQFAGDGHQVIILASNEAKLKLAATSLGVDYVAADIGNYEQVQAAVDQVQKKYGRIDVLINNAGVWVEGTIDECEVNKIRQAIEVNLLGLINVSKAVVPSMRENNFGLIVNINSDAGEEYKSGKTVYCASKWGVTGFTKSLRRELESTGIRVTYVMPGRMRTNFFNKAGVDKDLQGALEPEYLARMVKYIVDLPAGVVVPSVRMESMATK